MSGMSFLNNIKRWWFDNENLLIFNISIWPFDISIVLVTLFFNFEIQTSNPLFYIHGRAKSIFEKILKFNKYKGGNISLYFYTNLRTVISISKIIHSDHTPFEIEIGILGLTFYFYKYDYRHWDDDNDRYKEYNQERTT